MARIIAISMFKGGPGKTTLAVNLAAGLARGIGNRFRPFRVLLVDLDPQADATLTYIYDLVMPDGDEMNPDLPNMYHVLLNRTPILDVAHEVVLDANPRLKLPEASLFLAPAHDMMREASGELASKPASDQRLKMALDRVRNRFDYILIDCPPSDRLLTHNALFAADEVILPVEPGLYGLNGLDSIIGAIEEVNSFRPTPLHLNGIVPSKMDNTGESKETLEFLKENFGDQLLPVIPLRAAIRNATTNNLDVYAYATDKRSLELVKAFEALTKGVISHGA